MKTLSAIIIITFFSAVAFAQAGELDNSFGIDGKTVTNLGCMDNEAFNLALQQDGKIVVVGMLDFPLDYYDSIVGGLVRYNSNGLPDSSFGIDGIVTFNFNPAIGWFGYAAIQQDGKIIVVGTADFDILMARFNTNGSLDSTFGEFGFVRTDFGGNENSGSLAIQSDGKILAAGNPPLIRYNSNGSIDSSFGLNGVVTSCNGCRSVTIQNDNKIVVGGSVNSDFAVWRLEENGTLDSTFGIDGRTTIDINSNNGPDVGGGVQVQSNGEIVQAGVNYHGWYSTKQFAVARFKSNGIPDSTFGDEGSSVYPIPNNSYDEVDATGMTVQPDGKVIITGTYYSSWGWAHFALARFNADGKIDSSFGTDGLVITSFGYYDDYGGGVVLDSIDRILMVGAADLNGNGPNDFGVVRYLNDLALGQINFFSQSSSPLIYPNPIHQTETLEYTLTKNESLTIALYDMNGKLIRNFFSNEQRTAGAHKEILNIGELPSGNYFLTISHGEEKMTVKMVKQ